MNQSSTHILVVDDHSEIRDLLKRFLEQHGLRVSRARDGKEMKRLLEDKGALDAALRLGAQRASAIAEPIVTEAERLVGFLPR